MHAEPILSPVLLEALPGSTVSAELARALAAFGPIGLAELESVALLERKDSKFILSEAQLDTLLPRLAADYRVLEIQDRRIHGYRTVYFDTPALDLFFAHHNSRPKRFKVRSRLYVDSRTAFFEIKARDARENTVKTRRHTGDLLVAVSGRESAFIEAHAPYPAGELAPRLLNSFSRITLANLERGERLTLDLGLAFAANGELTGLPGLVVAELKQARTFRDSPFLGLAREAGVRASSFSKYCVGVSLLYPGVKHNAFNPELRRARRIAGAQHVQ